MADSSSSFTLIEQLNFRADTATIKDAVVTVQHWTKRATGKPAAIYVVCFNGVEQNRQVCTTPESIAHLVDVMAKTRTEHSDGILSEEAAEALVKRRGGPELTWCHRAACGEPVPYASAVCADGHPTESVGRIQFASVAGKLAGVGQRRG